MNSCATVSFVMTLSTELSVFRSHTFEVTERRVSCKSEYHIGVLKFGEADVELKKVLKISEEY
jgi:hypothetical protein